MSDTAALRVLKFEEVESTNSLALEYAKKGEPEGLVITADYQSEGRGKPGRTWISPRGKNLLFSLLLRPSLKAHELPILTQLACHSIAKVLENHCEIKVEFKRPNDLLVKGKKICGILTEGVSRASGQTEVVIVGAGLNVNANAAEIPETASSLHLETNKEWDRDQLLNLLMKQLYLDLGENNHASRS